MMTDDCTFQATAAETLLLHLQNMDAAIDDQHHFVDFMGARKFSGHSVAQLKDTGTVAELVKKLRQFFESCQCELFVLHCVLHGDPSDGAFHSWHDNDGNAFSLKHVLSQWHMTGNSRDPKKCLFILLDSCYSGWWVHEMATKHSHFCNVCIQAAAAKTEVTMDSSESFTALWVTINLEDDQDMQRAQELMRPYLLQRQPCYTTGHCCRSVHLNGAELKFLGEEVKCSNKPMNLCDILVLKKVQADDLFADDGCMDYYQQIQMEIWGSTEPMQDVRTIQNRMLKQLGPQARAFIPALEELTHMLNISD